jgi:hypothetical protein
MAQTLEHNKAVTTVVPVSIPTFDDDLAIIQKLDDEPNDVGGLTAMELKAKFDEGNVTAQQYINNVLIPAVVADDLTEQTRAAAEAERVANEIERVASETNRLSAENARVTNEANRVIAEAAREQAEQARVNSTTGIVAQATAKANEATAAASAAAQDASIARTSAESAQSASGIASSASNAAQAAATSASSSASTASSAANRASASESSAASSAETAKRYAEQASSAGAGDMLQSVYDPTYKRQDIFKYANTKISEHNSNTSAHADIRTALDGKAPVGPPMEIGVEYQTAERYMGKPVFTTLVNAGSLPDTTTKNVAHGISNIEYVFDCRGVTSGGDSLPYVAGNARIDITAGKTNVSVCTSYGAPASMNAYITIRYTKRA